jgi:hypothetical protein
MVEFADLGGDPVQEHTIVRDHHESAAELLEVILEPLHGG